MQYADAVACSNVVQSGGAVCAGGDQLGAGSIKVDVEHLVDVPSQGLEDLAAAHVPDLAGPVDGTGRHELPAELELGRRNLPLMVFQQTHALPAVHVPDLIIGK